MDDQLRPGLKSGEIQKQQFRVWDKNLKRVTLVVAYSITSPKAAEKKPWTPDEIKRARALRAEGKSWRQIGEALGRTPDSVRHQLR